MRRKKIIQFMVILACLLALAGGCQKKTGETNGENTTTPGVETGTKEPEASLTETPTKDNTQQEEKSPYEGIDLKAATDIKYSFKNVSVHDPSVVKVDDTYYIFGSHLAAAKTTDLMNFTLIASGVNKTNPIIPDAMNEMKESFEWAKTNTFWAPDVIQLNDGKYYMYYCNCEGSSPLSALGVGVSDSIEGPYKDLGIILKSGMGPDIPSEDGNTYNATVQPNVVDPCVFFDKDNKLWMVYGSYSGGIFILEMDPNTGMPLESGYGKKLLGANHLRIEAPYIIYSPETDYYYLFLSYGGLASDGGYQIRVARSKTPDGPYYDTEGTDMINCKGPAGTFFDDAAASKYGAKLMGNFSFLGVEGENGITRRGYVSPGHNSAIYEESTNKYFLFFHSRFEGRGEAHEVRVHQMFMNEEGWPVVAPYRYTGETIGVYQEEEIIGTYKVINHMKDITANIKTSVDVVLNEDHTISGAYKGTWELKGDHTAIITVGNVTYEGVFLKQWDEPGLKNVMTFTVLSEYGMSIWGSGYEALE